MSQISEAVESMAGSELVLFLTTFTYKESKSESGERPEFGSEEYGAYYNDLQDAGTLDYAPDTWAEVEALAASGKLDRETYYAVLEDRVASAGDGKTPDAPVE